MQEFNLLYIDETGKKVRAYRRKDKRRLVLEDGREFCGNYMSNKMDFAGYVNGKGPRNYSPEFKVNPVNGFKIRVK